MLPPAISRGLIHPLSVYAYAYFDINWRRFYLGRVTVNTHACIYQHILQQHIFRAPLLYSRERGGRSCGNPSNHKANSLFRMVEQSCKLVQHSKLNDFPLAPHVWNSPHGQELYLDKPLSRLESFALPLRHGFVDSDRSLLRIPAG